MQKEIEEYFFEKYKNSSVKVVPGHWPDFESKEHVDEWMDTMERIKKVFAKDSEDEPRLIACPVCGCHEHSPLTMVNKTAGTHYIKCRRCGTRTTEYAARILAIKAWNDGAVIENGKRVDGGI